MTIPLFDVEPAAPEAELSARGLELIMAGRCAHLDATQPDWYDDFYDIVWLSADWHGAFYGPADDGDPLAVHQLLQSGRLILGAPVVARIAGVAHDAHLVVGPVEGRS